MRVIVLSCAVAFCLTAFAFADAASDVVDVFASMSAALSNDNLPGFLKSVSTDMKGRDELSQNVSALLDQADIASSLEFRANDGDDKTRTVAIDWYLEIRGREIDAPVIRRREMVHCKLEREKKGWKVTSIDPLSLFAPVIYQGEHK
ncbi:MAG: hypothetical protein ACRD4P_08150 [Bryobacteraceae bacterium]